MAEKSGLIWLISFPKNWVHRGAVVKELLARADEQGATPGEAVWPLGFLYDTFFFYFVFFFILFFNLSLFNSFVRTADSLQLCEIFAITHYY